MFEFYVTRSLRILPVTLMFLESSEKSLSEEHTEGEVHQQIWYIFAATMTIEVQASVVVLDREPLRTAEGAAVAKTSALIVDAPLDPHVTLVLVILILSEAENPVPES